MMLKQAEITLLAKITIVAIVAFLVLLLPNVGSANYLFDENIDINNSMSGISNSFMQAEKSLNTTHNNVEDNTIEGTPEPFGSIIFRGNFSRQSGDGINDDYIIQNGDSIAVAIWGNDTDFKENLIVDNQGNIFIPRVGPVKVAGVKSRDLNQVVKSKISAEYSSNANIYLTLNKANLVSAYVTGYVRNPGKYAATANDSILHFIDRAGGIDAQSGSYRDVRLMRNGEVVESFDLYEFLDEGIIPKVQIEENDVIFIGSIGDRCEVTGEALHQNVFEFAKPLAEAVSEVVGERYKATYGRDIIRYSKPKQTVTNVSIATIEGDKIVSIYKTIKEFESYRVKNGDKIMFHSALRNKKIKIFIEGEHEGEQVIVAPIGVDLLTVLSQIEVKPELANYKSVRVERDEVAQRQKIALHNSLQRLQESAFSSQSFTLEDQQYKAEEAKIIQQFIENAKKAKPSGKIIVSENGVLKNIIMQDNDRIIIPKRTNIVLVSGEVNIPGAVVFDDSSDLDDYIENAGGMTLRADSKNILILKTNGAAINSMETDIEAGDEIVVLPEIRLDRLSFAGKMMDIIYKMVLSVAIPIRLIND